MLKNLLLLVISLLVLIFFESAQQYYYIDAFDLHPKGTIVTFGEILNLQLVWWMVWSAVAAGFFYYLFNHPIENFNGRSLLRLSGLVVTTFLITVLIYALIQVLKSGGEVSVIEVVIFKVFQKAPISLIAYSFMAIMVHLYLNKREFEVLVENMTTLEDEMKEIKESQSIKVLSTKIGDSRQVIKLDEIMQIEANDYCVDVHTSGGKKYVMRTSLKTLEKKLPAYFFRIHRRHIVNLNFVQSVNSNGISEVTLKNNEKVQVAKSRIKEFNAALSI
ncbi:LytR/AlgR family response regulator transcription factor [Fulvivirga lutimaris]|uniref:LytR/AlgR family response regulator transcription factor n=1 Tax=Fulvivirga lutimaris TaxID=1819566 RepID=UPI0012BB6562|nr:LytTR family DNA-binding domain-containing protein [Fulvivirga lutimaris]MTI40743.1 LytTR family transcriptional regulator [Fulvivirga lutimaris]